MAASKRWTIVASGGDQPLSELAQRLGKAGFVVDQVLTEIGCITGAGNDEVAEQLRALPGVAAVEPELGIDIGPPDAAVTW
jgi:hypothetical protein